MVHTEPQQRVARVWLEVVLLLIWFKGIDILKLCDIGPSEYGMLVCCWCWLYSVSYLTSGKAAMMEFVPRRNMQVYGRKLIYDLPNFCRSQWPRGLRRRSAAARLLRSWVWIPRGHRSFSVVSVVCCQVEVSATSWSLVQRSPTYCGALLCVI